MNEFIKWDIIEKSFKNNRWYIRLTNGTKTKTMPFANYIWLKCNPIFNDIPGGYVIHHLDYNPTNDDISNLALMQKHHHTAHHWKNKNVEVPVNIDETNGVPVKRPKVNYWKSRGIWIIDVQIRTPGGKIVKKRLYNTGETGENFKSKEEAEQAVCELWPGCAWPD